MKKMIMDLFCIAGLVSGAVSADDGFETAEALKEHILTMRSAPLTHLTVRASLHVRNFGAIPNDGKDDRPAVAAAIAKARSMEGPVEVLFESGCYDIFPATENFEFTRPENAGVFLQHCENMMIRGDETQFLIHRQDVSAFCVINSTNIIIRGFTVDYDPLPFSQGTVKSVDAPSGSFVLKLHRGFPRPDDPFFESCNSWGMLKNSAHPGRLKANCPSVFQYKEIIAVDDRHFQVVLSKPSQINHFVSGENFAIVGRSASIGRYRNSDNITFDYITAYACPAPVFIGEGTSRLNVLNCKMKLKDNRLLTNGGGGVICQGSRIGPWVENCEFEGLSDDCLNIYGVPIYVLEQISPVRLKVYAKAAVHVGDRLIFFNPNEGRIIQETTVASFSDNILMLNDPVGPLNTVPRDAKGSGVDRKEWKTYDHAYNLDSVGNYYVFRNNTMRDGRRYGVLLRASWGLIENNRFEGLSHSGIAVINEPGWPEGFWAQNLIISSNRVVECGYMGRGPSIRIASLKLNGVMDVPIQKNIFLLGNEFHAASSLAALFESVHKLTLENNVFHSEQSSGPLVVGKNITGLSAKGNAGESRFQFE